MESLGLSKIAEDRKYYLSIILGSYQINKSGDTLFCFFFKTKIRGKFQVETHTTQLSNKYFLDSYYAPGAMPSPENTK